MYVTYTHTIETVAVLNLLFPAVVDDTDHDRITAGSLVTLSVTLHRSSLIEHCGISLEELMAEESSDHNKDAPPLQDGHIPEDEVYYDACSDSRKQIIIGFRLGARTCMQHILARNIKCSRRRTSKLNNRFKLAKQLFCN